MEKIILDINQKRKSGDFVLNLDGILGIEDINLNIDDVIEDLNKEIENENFERANKYNNLLIKLSEYGNKKVDMARIRFYNNKISYYYKNLDKDDIDGRIEINREINNFKSFLLSLRYNDLDINIEDVFKDLENIKREVTLTKYIIDRYDNCKNINLQHIRIINKAIDLESNHEINEVKNKMEERLNEIIASLKGLNKADVSENVKKILVGEYEEDFFSSEEFYHNVTLNLKYNELENYKDLLKYIDKVYLLYSFNKAENIDKRIEKILNYGMDEFINIPQLIRELSVDKISSRDEKILLVDDFFNILYGEINKFEKFISINSLQI